MRRPLPSLRLTLNLNYKVLLGLTFFFLTHCLSQNSLSQVVCLFVHVFLIFGFVLLLRVAITWSILLFHFATTPCYCRSTLLLAPLWCCVLCHSALLLLWTPPCCYYELHLATPMSSTLLWLQAPPCYILCLAIVPPFYYYSTIAIALPTFLPCCVAIQPYCFFTFAARLLALGTNGLTWNSYCCVALLSLLCLATTDCFLCLLSWYFHNSLFPSRFWFLELE